MKLVKLDVLGSDYKECGHPECHYNSNKVCSKTNVTLYGDLQDPKSIKGEINLRCSEIVYLKGGIQKTVTPEEH